MDTPAKTTAPIGPAINQPTLKTSAKTSAPRFKIEAANKQFNGTRYDVQFKDGVAFTDDEEAVRQIRDLGGYSVDDTDLNAQLAQTATFKIEGGSRERAGGIGIKYVGDVGYTSDAKKAHACQEYGCKVTDLATGAPAFQTKDEAAKK
jgi:hypothetical protein